MRVTASGTSPSGAATAHTARSTAIGIRTGSSRAYYNEIDAFAARWLRNLIAEGHIAPGEVDERSIVDVHPDDLKGFTQCHFFAGIGGWSLAARMAGWPDDLAVWSGSCPCQPLSSAGQRKGHADERHLWPAFYGLIAECRPTACFGEQVASKDGREWLGAVRADLEALGYAVGAADLCAAGVGAPHIRQRLWWVADAHGGHADSTERQARHTEPGGTEARSGEPAQSGASGFVGDAWGDGWGEGRRDAAGGDASSGEGAADGRRNASAHDGWHDLAWLPCRDGKARPTQPGLQPLAHGIPGRVGRLRAYGNAIVPQVAAQFIGAFMECQP